METDPPADALAAAIGHGNKVFGLNNDVGKSSGEELNEYGGEASGEKASLPRPKPKRIYNTVGSRKRKMCLSRHKKGQQKQTTYDFSASRAAIGIPNDNSQQIASALVGYHKLRYNHRSPTKENVKRERSSLKRAFDHLQKSHECRGNRVKKLMAEKRGLLARINDDKKESKRYTDAIQIDAEKVYSDAFVLMEEAKEKKRYVHDNINFYPMEYIALAMYSIG